MVATVHHPPARLRARRNGKGLRIVLTALVGREIPVTAQGLFIELRDQGHHLGLATVYRALHALRDDGRLHEFQVEDGVAFRACVSRSHHHLICVECGRVQEGQPTEMASWLHAIERDGFAVVACTVDVHGVCERCRDARPRTS